MVEAVVTENLLGYSFNLHVQEHLTLIELLPMSDLFNPLLQLHILFSLGVTGIKVLTSWI